MRRRTAISGLVFVALMLAMMALRLSGEQRSSSAPDSLAPVGPAPRTTGAETEESYPRLVATAKDSGDPGLYFCLKSRWTLILALVRPDDST